MRIFALETDQRRIVHRFCHDHDGECVVLLSHYHVFSFLFSIARDIIVTVFLIAGLIGLWITGPFPMESGMLMLVFVLWFLFVFLHIVKAYLDWRFDLIIVTTDKIILVDQTSIFKQEIKPIHVENIGGVSTFTQFWNILGFGGMRIHLKEGLGGKDYVLKYVPHAEEVAGRVSDVVTRFQRRQYNKLAAIAAAAGNEQK